MRKSFLPSAVAALALVLVPAAALAHVRLVSSTPTANTAASRVASVNLRFNEKVVASTVKVELLMTGMPGMADHPPMKISFTSAMGRDGKSMILTLRRNLVPGTYKVKWSAAGADTHRVASEFNFTVR